MNGSSWRSEDMMTEPSYPEIREAVRRLCAAFPANIGGSWIASAPIPTEFVAGADARRASSRC